MCKNKTLIDSEKLEYLINDIFSLYMDYKLYFPPRLELKASLDCKINELFENFFFVSPKMFFRNQRLDEFITFLSANKNHIHLLCELKIVENECITLKILQENLKRSLKTILSQYGISHLTVDLSTIRIMLASSPKLRINFIDETGQNKVLTFQTDVDRPFTIGTNCKWKLIDCNEPEDNFATDKQLRSRLLELYKLDISAFVRRDHIPTAELLI